MGGFFQRLLGRSPDPVLQAAYSQGAPRTPWDVTDADRGAASALCAECASRGIDVDINEAAHAYGRRLEVVMRGGEPEAGTISVFSRTWDPDRRELATFMMLSGKADMPLVNLMRRHGFEFVFNGGDEDTSFGESTTMFCRSLYSESRGIFERGLAARVANVVARPRDKQ